MSVLYFDQTVIHLEFICFCVEFIYFMWQTRYAKLEKKIRVVESLVVYKVIVLLQV